MAFFISCSLHILTLCYAHLFSEITNNLTPNLIKVKLPYEKGMEKTLPLAQIMLELTDDEWAKLSEFEKIALHYTCINELSGPLMCEAHPTFNHPKATS